MKLSSPILLAGVVALIAGCGQGLDEPYCEDYACECPATENCALVGTAVNFEVLDRRMDFFAAPWPADPRLGPDGHPDLSAFPNPANSSMLMDYVETVQSETVGWGTNQAIYFTFDGPLDEGSLPSGPAETLDAGASAFLIDVSDGPGRGQRSPVAVRYLEAARQFTPAHTLVLRPVLGFPLREATPYAAVITRDVRDAQGARLGAPDLFERTKYAEAPLSEALVPWWESLQPVWGDLEQLADLDRAEIAAVAVFTTQNIHAEMEAVQAFVDAEARPTASDWNVLGEMDAFYRVEAWFEMPEFQAGDPPDFEGGGGFVFDEDGQPVVQRRPSIPFTLAFPKDGAMPAAGWPIVVYAHGTGGSRNGFANQNSDVAALLAARGIASIGIDQPLHGDRNPWGRNEDIITFNPYNILAMRDNFRQGAADLMVLRRLLEDLRVPAGVSPTGTEVRFDDDKVAYMGHSQGCLNGPAFLSLADDVRGAVLSGSGGGLGPAILGKTEPVDIPALIILGLGLVEEEFDLDHPVVALFQLFAERADPINYAARLIAEPPAGLPSKHLFFSQGLLDLYALPHQAAAMAAASGCAPMAPLVEPIEPFVLRGVETLDPPVHGNTSDPDGNPITAVMVQYPNDGHFAVFDNDDAKRHYLGFLETLLTDGVPTVGP